MIVRALFAAAALLLSLGVSVPAQAQVSYERLRTAAADARNWLTYSGTYFSQRYSTLGQITPANV
ncbi:MAG TPA: hypothetical protein VG735_10975, partial [Caulobacterales bacterium]|nr:hypothetical protein [Caulobacterales bacterium]